MAKTPPFERAFLRTTEDGTTVFFPWGLAHRGYELPDAEARSRASRAASLLIGATIAVGTWTAHLLQPLIEYEATAAQILEAVAVPGAVFVAVMVGYWGWASRFVESLPESSLRITREERLAEAAGLVAPWKVAVFGLGIAALGLVLIGLQPRAWLPGAGALALGVGALIWAAVLRSERHRGEHARDGLTRT